SVLAFLEPVSSVALAALGVLCGMDLCLAWFQTRRITVLAATQATATGLVVALGAAAIASRFAGVATGMPLIAAVILGVCPASSASLPLKPPSERTASLVSTADGLVPLVFGGLLLAILRQGSVPLGLWLLAQSILVGLAIAIAAWLLLSQTSSA